MKLLKFLFPLFMLVLLTTVVFGQDSTAVGNDPPALFGWDLATILNVVFGALSAFLGTWLVVAKNKLAQLLDLFIQTSELLQKIVAAGADNKWDPDELNDIKKEANDVIVAFKTLTSFKV